MKAILASLVAASGFVLAPAAHAAETISITGPSGTFGNDAVQCSADVVTCAFTNMFTFVTPTSLNLVNATISTSALGGNNIDFTSVFLNGMALTLSPTGTFEFGSLESSPLMAGALNTLTVNGRNTGNSAFSGTLTFANVPAVPEPGTWAMMLLGFGAIGFAMRRRKAAEGAQRVRVAYS